MSVCVFMCVSVSVCVHILNAFGVVVNLKPRETQWPFLYPRMLKGTMTINVRKAKKKRRHVL